MTHGSLTLQSGTYLGEALVYPAPIRESEFPQSFFASPLTYAGDHSAFHDFEGKVKSSFIPSDYPEYESCLLQLLFSHSSAIALPGQPLGCTHLLEHKIDLLPDARPLFIPAYRLRYFLSLRKMVITGQS